MEQTEKNIHRNARFHVNAGFQRLFGRRPATSEAQVIQGIGWLETRYSAAWKGSGIGSHNMGAIQCCKPKNGPAGQLICPDDTFLYTDTHPLPSGKSEPYSICFKRYMTPGDGFFDLCRVACHIHGRERVLKAAQRGSVWDCSAQLRDTGYYEGFGKTREERIGNHAKALGSAIARQSEALGEPAMEPFSIDEWAEEQHLLARVKFLMRITLEYSPEENAEAARKAILDEAIRDAEKPISKPWWAI